MAYKDPAKQKEKTREWDNDHPEARRKRQAAYRSRVSTLIAEAKNKPCADCKETFPSFVMDFDHRDPSTKMFTISGSVKNQSIPNILLEIEKCDVVCANCHRIRTFLGKNSDP